MMMIIIVAMIILIKILVILMIMMTKNTEKPTNIVKGWLAIATLKPTFTFLGRDFAIFNTFTWQNPYQEN